MNTPIILFAPSLLLFVAVLGLLAGAWLASLLEWRSVLALLVMAATTALGTGTFVWALPYSYPSRWMAAAPAGVLTQARQAIIFGYGYELLQGRIRADDIHLALLDWTLTNTNASMILVQEAVFVAALGAGWSRAPGSSHVLVHEKYPGRHVRRFHRHSPHYYVSTAEAVLCALPLLSPGEPTLLVAHPDHLARVAYNARMMGPREWIVPALPALGSNANSVHPQTRSASTWLRYEVLGARVRDLLASLPLECGEPISD